MEKRGGIGNSKFPNNLIPDAIRVIEEEDLLANTQLRFAIPQFPSEKQHFGKISHEFSQPQLKFLHALRSNINFS